MTNLNSMAFLDTTQNSFADKSKAEMYMQIYKYAAEDFTTIPDVETFIANLTAWQISVDKRLQQQMQLISTHVHRIPPHSHPGGKGGPIPLITLVPNTSSAIKWIAIPYPVYINTTLTIPNRVGNFVTVSLASEGSAIPRVRRAKPIDLTLVPLLSPVLEDIVYGGIGV